MKHILIVDDEYIIASSLAMYLSNHGYKTTVGKPRGEEIIKALKQKHFDLIVISADQGNGLNGVETIREIRTFSTIPVIYLTTHINSKTMREEADKTNPVGFISKPCDYEELRKAVEKGWRSSEA